ncbi:MIP/aquaporin family protein [soil metagenome]
MAERKIIVEGDVEDDLSVEVGHDREGLGDQDLPAYAAELVGTFLLVFFICLIVSVAAGLQVSDFAVIGLVHVFVLSMLIYTLGGTSGAHFNPAVTVALAALREIRPIDAVIYIFLQLSGAIAGALLTKALLLDEGEAANYGATLVGPFLSGKAFPGLIAEAMGTFVLMWAIMGTAVNPRGRREWAGLVIGGTLGFAVMAIGPLTGAGFNPARSFGPALVSGEWANFWIYVVGPLLGALLAAFAYQAIAIAPQRRRGDRPVDKLP